MIIDTHVHIVAADRQKYPRQLGHAGISSWVHDLPVEQMLQHMDEAGIDQAVLSQAFGVYRDDNSYLADSVARYPNRFAATFAVDPLKEDAALRVSYWVRERGLHGLRMVTLTEPELRLDDPRTLALWEAAGQLQIPLCIIVEFGQVPLLPGLLERFPGVTVALEHLGMPRLGDGPPYSAIQPLFNLARFPNCQLKFSTVNIDAAMKGRNTCAEFFQPLVDRFGPGRLMWGSNFPSTHDRSLKRQLDLAQEQLSFLSQEERSRIFAENALSLWPMLKPPSVAR
jgi:L-fuconolactonase